LFFFGGGWGAILRFLDELLLYRGGTSCTVNQFFIVVLLLGRLYFNKMTKSKINKFRTTQKIPENSKISINENLFDY